MDNKNSKKNGWDISVIFNTLGMLVFCIFASISQCESRGALPPLYDLEKKSERARRSFEDVYYALLKSHFFDDVNNPNAPYSSNLIISTDFNEDPILQGTILLNLISWLEKKNDRDSRFLLHKINRLYHLEFHRILSGLSLKKKAHEESLLGSFHDLSKYKIFNVAIGADYPFGNSITKAILTLLVVNKTSVPYAQKKESVFYTLEKIKQEMLRINNGLGDQKIDENIIRAFIFGLEKFGVRETLVESKLFRNAVILIIVIGSVSLLAYKWDMVRPFLKKAADEISQFLKDSLQGVSKVIAEGFEDEWHLNERADRMEAQIADLKEHREDYIREAAEAAIRGVLEAAAHPAEGVDAAPEAANPDLEIVVGRAIDGAIRSALRAAAHPAEGVNAAPGVANPDLELIVNRSLAPLVGKVDEILAGVRTTRVGRALVGNQPAPQPVIPAGEEFHPAAVAAQNAGSDDGSSEAQRPGFIRSIFW